MSDQGLEQRVAALEAQAGSGGGGGGGGGGGDATVQAFLQGALAAYAMSQQQSQGAQAGQGLAGGGTTGEQGIFGWNPTRYDSIMWCRSRFMCNPQSISCLC